MLQATLRIAERGLHRSVAIRWFSLALLLGGELLALTTSFDTGILAQRPGFLAQALGYSPALLSIGLAFFSVLLLIAAPRLAARVTDIADRSQNHTWPLWLGLHLAAFAGFVLLSSHIFAEGSTVTPVSVASATAWLVLALTTLLFWLLAIAPWNAWLWLLAEERWAVLASGAIAIGIWLLGQATQALWRPLAGATFWIVRQQLGLLYPDVVADAGRRILGTSSFQVEIAPSCSGYEGIGLIVAFVSVYLWLFRKNLRFPQALLLVPIGAGIIWLLNTLRVTALIAIGTSWSPQIAAGGFHSQAGWISFLSVALLVVYAAHRASLFALDQPAVQAPAAPHAALATALLAPFIVLMVAGIATTAFSPGFDAWYPIKILVTAGALWYFRTAYRQLIWGWSWESFAIGIGVFVVWLLLEPVPKAPETLQDHLAAVPVSLAALWLLFRVLGSVVIIPLVEELAFRGYLLRKLTTWNFEEADPKRFTVFAFLVSSLLFGLLHGRWFAGTLAGMAYALAIYRRGRVSDAIFAHSTTNALIALAVLLFGQWHLW